MIIGSMQKQSMSECAALLQQLEPGLFDMVELRLDACRDLDTAVLAGLPRPVPVLFTLRCAEEGGAFAGSEESRLSTLEQLMTLHPDFVDLEASIPPERIRAIRAVSPRTRLILSKHDFTGTPDNLDAVLQAMQATVAASHPAADARDVIYKIAVRAHTTLDALRMLAFCRKHSAAGVQLVGISMGEDGVTTRILAPVVHSGLCYCPVDEATAPGQVDARTLRSVYNFANLNHETAIYGLVGDPVAQSIGHMYHNECNVRDGRNAVYVKWRLSREQVASALGLMREIGVSGLSATMPLKDVFMPFLTEVDDALALIGAVNTLKFHGQSLLGLNTDGKGAVLALPEPVAGKRVIVLGAGGAARAVMDEVHRQGGLLTVFNRSEKPLPAPVKIRPFSELSALRGEDYDMVINALPFNADFDFSRFPFAKGTVAFDLSYAKPGDFIRLALEAGCRMADGRDMFFQQAALQRTFWGL